MSVPLDIYSLICLKLNLTMLSFLMEPPLKPIFLELSLLVTIFLNDILYIPNFCTKIIFIPKLTNFIHCNIMFNH